MDPITLALLSSSLGTGTAAAGAAGSAALGGSVAGPALLGSLGSVLSGIKAPETPEPKFGGGVSGSSLPYRSQITDLISPFINNINQREELPSLGQLLSQVPGR